MNSTRLAIGLGSSLGPRGQTLALAVQQLAHSSGLRLLNCSRGYRTPPLKGGHATGWFLNAVALFETTLSPAQVLGLCKSLEDRALRRRSVHWADRTLDLDILLFGHHIVRTASLTIPHTALLERAFVLTPLLEVWPDAVYPTTGRPLAEVPSPPGPKPVAVGLATNRSLRY